MSETDQSDDKKLKDIIPIFSSPPRREPRSPSGTLRFNSTDGTEHRLAIFAPSWEIERHVIPIVGAESPFRPHRKQEKLWREGFEKSRREPHALRCLLTPLEKLLTGPDKCLHDEYGDEDRSLTIRFRLLSEILGIRLRVLNQAVMDYSNHYFFHPHTQPQDNSDSNEPEPRPTPDQIEKVFEHHFQQIERLLESRCRTNLAWPGSSRSKESGHLEPIITTYHFSLKYEETGEGESVHQKELHGSLKLSSDEASTYLPNKVRDFHFETDDPDIWNHLRCLQAKLDSSLCDAIELTKDLTDTLEKAGTSSNREGILKNEGIPLKAAMKEINQVGEASRHQLRSLVEIIRSIQFSEPALSQLRVTINPPKITRFDTYCLALNYSVNLYQPGAGPSCEDYKAAGNQLEPIGEGGNTTAAEEAGSFTDRDCEFGPFDEEESSSSAYFTPPPPSSN